MKKKERIEVQIERSSTALEEEAQSGTGRDPKNAKIGTLASTPEGSLYPHLSPSVSPWLSIFILCLRYFEAFLKGALYFLKPFQRVPYPF